MNKIKIFIVSLMLMGLFFSSCGKDDESPIITETFDLETFSAIDLLISGNVRIIECQTL